LGILQKIGGAKNWEKSLGKKLGEKSETKSQEISGKFFGEGKVEKMVWEFLRDS